MEESNISLEEVKIVTVDKDVASSKPRFNKKLLIKKMLELKNFSIATLVFSGIYMLALYASLSIVPNGGQTFMAISAVCLTIIMTLHCVYIYVLWTSKDTYEIKWNIDKILWNCFVILALTIGSIFTFFMFIMRSQKLSIMDDFINKLDPIQTLLLLVSIIFYILLLLMLVYHIIWHRKLILNK